MPEIFINIEGNEHYGSIKCPELLDHMRNYYLPSITSLRAVSYEYYLHTVH